LTRNDPDPDAPYRLVDVVAKFVREGGLAASSSRLQAYSILRGFFNANRASLPQDRSVRLLGLPSSTGKMTDEDLRKLVAAAKLRDRSWLLVKTLGFMGWKELAYTNLHGHEVVKQVRRDIIRVDFPLGRKRNNLPYYSLFGGSARETLKQFLDEERGRVKPGEAIWYTKDQEAMTARSFKAVYKGLVQRVGLVPACLIGKEKRHGYGGHQTRHVVRSLWHRSKADKDCAEFFMGHGKLIDPNKYNRIFRDDPEWVMNEYRSALPHIDIMNTEATREVEKQQSERIEAMQRQINEAMKLIEEMRRR